MTKDADEIYGKERLSIRSKCACVSDDAAECSSRRYGSPPEDADDFCECPCHAELNELANELFYDEEESRP